MSKRNSNIVKNSFLVDLKDVVTSSKYNSLKKKLKISLALISLFFAINKITNQSKVKKSNGRAEKFNPNNDELEYGNDIADDDEYNSDDSIADDAAGDPDQIRKLNQIRIRNQIRKYNREQIKKRFILRKLIRETIRETIRKK